MSEEQLYRLYGDKRLNDRQLDELIGLAHGIIADGQVNQSEVEYLQKWLVANIELRDNPIVQNLLLRVNDILLDKTVTQEEAAELFDVLRRFSGGDFELGEVLKASSLPLDTPPPEIAFPGSRFCFTGSFAFGTRDRCEQEVKNRGAVTGSLTNGTNYLVIGIYATGSWAHSTFGRKLEKAVEMKRDGFPIAIVGETHWRKSLDTVPCSW